MQTRIKIEIKNGKNRYAYVEAGVFDMPAVLLDGTVHEPSDMPGAIVTSDKDLAAKLADAGYDVRISDPQAAWGKKNLRTVSTRISAADLEAYQKYCAQRGIKPYEDIKAHIERCIRP